MTMVELLENDREQLIGNLENAPQPEHAREALEKEADRLLYQYNETQKQAASCLTAADMMQVCRMGLPLVDSVTEHVVWTASEDRQKKKEALFLPTCLLGAGAVVLVILLAGMAALSKIPVVCRLLITVGFGLCFASGFLYGRQAHGKNEADPARQRVENRVDAKGVYRTFRGIMQTVDQNISRAASREELELPEQYSGALQDGELVLLSGLLEALYTRDGDAALDKLEDIRYFLHRNGIEIVDFEEEKRGWFDVMPSMVRATIRPALVSDGKLLRKGLAAGGK